jgi:hypothetical protein
MTPWESTFQDDWRTIVELYSKCRRQSAATKGGDTRREVGATSNWESCCAVIDVRPDILGDVPVGSDPADVTVQVLRLRAKVLAVDSSALQ